MLLPKTIKIYNLYLEFDTIEIIDDYNVCVYSNGTLVPVNIPDNAIAYKSFTIPNNKATIDFRSDSIIITLKLLDKVVYTVDNKVLDNIVSNILEIQLVEHITKYELKVFPATIDGISIELKRFNQSSYYLNNTRLTYNKELSGEYPNIRNDQYFTFTNKEPLPVDEYEYVVRVDNEVVLSGNSNIKTLTSITIPEHHNRYYKLEFLIIDETGIAVDSPQLLIYNFRQNIWTNYSSSIGGYKVYGDSLSIPFAIMKRDYITHQGNIIFTKPAKTDGCIIVIPITLKRGTHTQPTIPRSEDTLHLIRSGGNIYTNKNNTLSKIDVNLDEIDSMTFEKIRSNGISNNLKDTVITFDNYEIITWVRNKTSPETSIQASDISLDTILKGAKEVSIIALQDKK